MTWCCELIKNILINSRKFFLFLIINNVIFGFYRYLETVFKSQACINASFLRNNDSHYGSSRKNHGVDLEKATYYFDIISRIENETINEVVGVSIFFLNNFCNKTKF